MDFNTLKNITIPEGSVKQITDSQGRVLYKKEEWHTIFEGNVEGQSSSTNVCTLEPKDTIKIRVTYLIEQLGTPYTNINLYTRSESDTASAGTLLVGTYNNRAVITPYQRTTESICNSSVYNARTVYYLTGKTNNAIQVGNSLATLRTNPYQLIISSRTSGTYSTKLSILKVEQYY